MLTVRTLQIIKLCSQTMFFEQTISKYKSFYLAILTEFII